MCSKIPVLSKAQSVPSLPSGWTFYFVDAEDHQEATDKASLCHVDLKGLRIRSKSGRVYCSLEKVRAKKTDEEEESICQFYEKTVGVPARREVQHVLVGKGFCRQWTVDVNGARRAIHGKITACWQRLFHQDLHFKVEFSRESRSLLKETSGASREIPYFDDDVSEAVAWGGYVSFLENVGRPKQVKEFHHKWLFADVRVSSVNSNDQLPRCDMIVRGFRLTFFVADSLIPKGGLGFFVTCKPVSDLLKAPKYFELEAGCLLDLGIYAPLQAEDRKPEIVSLVKNFIHSWKAESWSFDLAHHDKGKHTLFDITDDWTGDLHEKAKDNFLVYVNETDGKEVPSILADHDPVSTEKGRCNDFSRSPCTNTLNFLFSSSQEGSVHYYMGHWAKEHGPFRITVGNSVELKIDYGEEYERVRVRKKYSRLSGAELEKIEASLLEDDIDVIRDLSAISINEVNMALDFVERLFHCRAPRLPGEKRTRAFIVALLLLARVRAVEKEFSAANLRGPDSFCDNGYTDMVNKNTASRAEEAVTRISGLWGQDDKWKESLVSQRLYQAVFMDVLKLRDFSAVKSLSASRLREKLKAYVDAS
jgi:hypothetical protein